MRKLSIIPFGIRGKGVNLEPGNQYLGAAGGRSAIEIAGVQVRAGDENAHDRRGGAPPSARSDRVAMIVKCPEAGPFESAVEFIIDHFLFP
jgi:hypothetical protein